MKFRRSSIIGSLARGETGTISVEYSSSTVMETLLSVAFMRFTLIYGVVPSFLTDVVLRYDMSGFVNTFSGVFGKAGEIRRWVSSDGATSVELEKAPDEEFEDSTGSYVAHFAHTNSDGATYTVEYLVNVKEANYSCIPPQRYIDFTVVS